MKKRTISNVQESSDEDYGTMEDDSSNNEGGKFVKSKRKSEGFERKKFKSSKLTKQPTSEELNRLRETENLFSSNFFRLQIEEVVKEVTVRPKYISRFNTWFVQFNKFIRKLKTSDSFDMNDHSWLDEMNVKLPMICTPSETKGFFKLTKLKPATVIGSFFYQPNLGPELTVDIKLEMSKDTIIKDDYLNERYQRKRAACLAYLAAELRDSGIAEDIRYRLFNESVSKPVLVFKPAGKTGKGITVVLHLCLEEDVFKVGRFAVSKNNIRKEWRFLSSVGTDNDSTTATPYYNNSAVMDLVYNSNNKFLNDVLKDNSNIKEAILLLKIWLRQRQMYSFSGYVMTMFVAYLFKMRRINNAMSSYQIIRNIWTALAASEWNKNGISLADFDGSMQSSSVSEYYKYFSVVFMDYTGYCNICAHVSSDVYQAIKHESELAVSFLDNQNINSFQALFMTPIDFNIKFDHILKINYSKNLDNIISEHITEDIILDREPDKIAVVKDYIADVLKKGLTNRVKFFSSKCLTDEEKEWPIDTNLKNANPLKKSIQFGFKLDSDYAFNLIDKGPQANVPEALEFRKFWGTKSELRRFQDGSISEACIWEDNSTMAARRLIVKKIIYYLLQVKLGIEKKIFYIADQFEFLLHNKRFQPSNFNYGTGEEAASKITHSLDGLVKNLRSLTEMPLEINSAQGTSPVFSFSETNPPLAYTPPNVTGFIFSGSYRLIPEVVKVDNTKRSKNQRTEVSCPTYVPALKVVLGLSHSGKWPEDLEALKNIKTAFYIQIAQALKQQCDLTAQARRDFVDVIKDGFAFRLEIGHQKEIALMKKMIDKDGIIKYRDTADSLERQFQLLLLPRLRVSLNGLYHQHQSFGSASCMVKRWIRSHMLDEFHFPDICIDFIVASTFLRPEPFEVPNQPQVAFMRTLQLLANSDWNTQMIILNFNNELKNEEIIEIENNFSSSRTSFPPLYIVVPYEEEKNSIWSKHSPSFKILARLQILAKEALNLIDDVVFKNLTNDIHTLFVPNKIGYDVLIYLKKEMNPLRHVSIQNQLKETVPHKTNPYAKQPNEFIPVLDFDPVQIYLNELRASYDEFALFFHDTYGGDVIGVLWKPPAMEFREFKTSTSNGRKVVQKDGKVGIVADLDAILEGFCILGNGLIESIENVSNLTT